MTHKSVHTTPLDTSHPTMSHTLHMTIDDVDWWAMKWWSVEYWRG